MSNVEANKQAQQRIEEDINRHLQTVTSLRRRRNILSPINSLPPELLSEIFYHCQERFPPPPAPYYRTISGIPAVLRWISVTWVCHHWRDVSLHNPGLWTKLCLDHTNFTKECALARVKEVPLHISISRWSASHIMLLRDLFPSFTRVHSIDFTIPDHAVTNVIPELSLTTSPLRSICIANRSLAHSSLLELFKNCELPSIEQLVLSGSLKSFPPHLLKPSLKELILTFEPFPAPTIDFPSFISCLSEMLQLRRLHLGNVVFGSPAEQLRQKVVLPKLDELLLQPPNSKHQAYLTLMENLKPPSNAQRCIKFGSIEMRSEDTPMLYHLLLEHLRSFDSRTLALSNAMYGFCVEFWEETLAFMAPAPPPRLKVWFPQPLYGQRNAWNSLLLLLNLQHVETVRLETFTRMRDHCRRFLQNCLHLRTLDLGEGSQVIVDILREPPNAAANNTNHTDATIQPIAPELKIISFTSVLWRTAEEVEEIEDGDEGFFASSVLDMIRKRKAIGHAVEKVVIRTCINMGFDDVQTLTNEGVVVDWDHNSTWQEREESESSYYGGVQVFHYDSDSDEW